MKLLNTLLLLLFGSIVSSFANSTIKVDFENGIPEGWIANGITVKKDNNSMRAAMSSGATLTSPVLSSVVVVEYKHRGSGNNKELIVEKSTDNGNTWTNIGSVRVSSASAYGSSGHTVGESKSDNVLLRFTCKSATIYIDDIIITQGSAGDEQPEGEIKVPTIKTSTAKILFGNTKVGEQRERSIKLSAFSLEPLEGTITISSNNDAITISSDGLDFSSSKTIDFTDGKIAETDISLRFAPKELKQYSAEILIKGGNAETTLYIEGTGSETGNNEYYIAPNGNDQTGDGTISKPWMNLQNVVNIAQPGDVIICRGGKYNFTTRDNSGKLTVRIKNSGTAEAPITIRNYDGETPIFDFEQQLIDCGRDRSKVGDRGILLTGNYWHLYGLHITHAADNGIKLEGSHNRIERCEFSYCLDTGLQLGFGHDFSASGFGSKNDGSYCAYNDIIDCDSHHNCDFDTNYGSDADGFACKMHNGKGNRFIRCRAWRNSDDAWDLYETDYSVYMIECWAWESGNASDHTWVYDYFDKGPNFSGNGNGIKLGGNGTGGSSKGLHYIYNCVAFGCDKSGSTKGFDCNHHKDGHYVVGGLAFDNGYDFMFESGGGANTEFYNNVCFGRQEILVGKESNNAFAGTPEQGKTFYNNVVRMFSRADYESLSETDALAPRGVDGSMPAKFARLKSTSKLIDAGIDKPLPFGDEFPFTIQPIYGIARDLGPYEFVKGTDNTGIQTIVTHEKKVAFELQPGQYDTEVIAKISTKARAKATIRICSLDGSTIKSMESHIIEPSTDYYLPISTISLSPGIYICYAHIAGDVMGCKMVVK